MKYFFKLNILYHEKQSAIKKNVKNVIVTFYPLSKLRMKLNLAQNMLSLSARQLRNVTFQTVFLI